MSRKLTDLSLKAINAKFKQLQGYIAKSGGSSAPYKVWTGILTQTGSATPVATVLQNTLGFNPVISSQFAGNYQIDFPDPVNKLKVFVPGYQSDWYGPTVVGLPLLNGSAVAGYVMVYGDDLNPTEITGIVLDFYNANFEYTEMSELISQFSIEFRIYP